MIFFGITKTIIQAQNPISQFTGIQDTDTQ
jgi:hypothetical protein